MTTSEAEVTEQCGSCGQDIPLSRYALHARGLDGAAPECPKQDLVEIAMRKRRGWDGRSDWDYMRSRFQNVPRLKFSERTL